MSGLRSLLSLGAVASLAAAVIAAAPVGAASTVTVDGDTVTVTGTLAEPLADVITGTDAGTDAIGSGAGVDLVQLSVGYPAPTRIAISLAIADANSASGHIPVGAQYAVAPSIGGTSYELIATATPDRGLVFASQTCQQGTGANTCTSSPVDGSYADGVLTWNLATSALPGAEVNTGTGDVTFSVSAGGNTLTGGLVYDQISTNVALAEIPGARLLIDGAEADTDRLSNDGYSLTASGLTSGEHTVEVELCGGAGECSITPALTFTVE